MVTTEKRLSKISRRVEILKQKYERRPLSSGREVDAILYAWDWGPDAGTLSLN